MAASGREFLGKRRAFGEVQRAYLRGAALEVDTYDWYDLRRRRLQLDEVQRITLHREVREGTLLFRTSIITVTSPRARVTIVHAGRSRRAREVFRLLADRTRETQAATSPAAGDAPPAE